jgi:hypothetical protein
MSIAVRSDGESNRGDSFCGRTRIRHSSRPKFVTITIMHRYRQRLAISSSALCGPEARPARPALPRAGVPFGPDLGHQGAKITMAAVVGCSRNRFGDAKATGDILSHCRITCLGLCSGALFLSGSGRQACTDRTAAEVRIGRSYRKS